MSPEERKKYYLDNKERISAAAKARYALKRAELLQKNKEYAEKHPEVNRKASAKYRAKNREKTNLAAKNWADKNKERVASNNKKWRLANNEKTRNYTLIRRTQRIQATPGWDLDFTEFVVEEAIKLCILREKTVGSKWEIDHTLPLQGKAVCGLHVWNNLAVVPKTWNRRKRNHVKEIFANRSWL